MSRTNIEIDDELMRFYGYRTKREAVDRALRRLDVKPASREEILAMEGVGWEGDLNQTRQNDPVLDAWINREYPGRFFCLERVLQTHRLRVGEAPGGDGLLRRRAGDNRGGLDGALGGRHRLPDRAVAIRAQVPVLADDRDFELIARHTPLRIAA